MAFHIVQHYLHPVTKIELMFDGPRISSENGENKDEFIVTDGIIDFVGSSGSEREHYDKLYSQTAKRSLTIDDFKDAWKKEPGFKELLESMGNVSGKKILLLGSGISVKELYFLHLDAKCVFTDLSLSAVKYMQELLHHSELSSKSGNVEFHAVDACKLPFANEEFDIVYGCSFVHHIEDINALFSEIYRCTRKGGICRFMDDAYSPLWQLMKKTILSPIQSYSHKRHGISPADLIATQRGGYKEEYIKSIMNKHSFEKMLYAKNHFFEHLFQRGTLKLGGKGLRFIKPVFRYIDSVLGRTSFIKTNALKLIWGFTK